MSLQSAHHFCSSDVQDAAELISKVTIQHQLKENSQNSQSETSSLLFNYSNEQQEKIQSQENTANDAPRSKITNSCKLMKTTPPVFEMPSSTNSSSPPRQSNSNPLGGARSDVTFSPETSGDPIKSLHFLNPTSNFGLPNIGNTCFLNSCMQLLTYCSLLSSHLIQWFDAKVSKTPPNPEKWQDKRKKMEYNRLLKLAVAAVNEMKAIRQIPNTSPSSATASSSSTPSSTMRRSAIPIRRQVDRCICEELHLKLGAANKRFKGYSQQDSHEAMVTILDAIHETTHMRTSFKQSGMSCEAVLMKDQFAEKEMEGKKKESEFKQFSDLKEKGDAKYDEDDEDDGEDSDAEDKYNQLDAFEISPSSTPSLSSSQLVFARAWQQFLSQHQSLVADAAMGLAATAVRCGECEQIRFSFMPFTVLTLNFPRKKGERSFSLAQCIKNFYTVRSVKAVQCGFCKKATSSRHCLLVARWPSVLLLHFNRFIPSTYGFRKDSIPVSIPRILNLSEMGLSFEDHEFSTLVSFPLPSVNYQLVGVVNHCGSISGGHYTCTAQTDDGKWRNHSDTHTSSVSPPTCSGDYYIVGYTQSPAG